jgi:soluble lytic murein transglycosylase
VNGAPLDGPALFDPDLNIRLGVRHMRVLLDRYRGDRIKVIAAYNGGEDAVDKWVQRSPAAPADEFDESISYRETRDYVKRVLANYRTYESIYRR